MTRSSARQTDLQFPVRVAFCITDLDPGGAERALFEIVKRLDKSRWKPHIYCLSEGGKLVSRFEQEGIGVSCFAAKSNKDLRVLLWLKRELKHFAPQILQGFLFHGNIASRLSGCWAGVPVRLAGHRVAEKQKKWHLLFDRLTAGFVSHHVCVSQGVANFIRQKLRLNKEQITVIGNGVDPSVSPAATNAIREELGLSKSTRIVLAVGRLHFQKGFDILIEAIASVVDQIDDIHLLIVGDGPEKDNCEQLISRFALERTVTMTGYRTDIPELMSEAAIYVLSSRWEGMPNVVLQAMQSQLPIVAFDVEGISELIQDQVSGRIVKPASAKDLGRVISELLTDQPACSLYSENAEAIVLKEFTWERIAQLYDQLYSSLLGIQNS